MTRQGLVAVGFVAASVIAARMLLVSPALVTAGAAGILFLLFSVRIIRHPRLTAVVAFLVLLLSETKFRTRDTGALLAGSVDSQVLFVLGLYAALAWLVVLTIIFPPKPARPISPAIGLGLAGYAALALLSTAWSPIPMITLVRSAQLAILVALAIALFVRTDPATIFESLLIALVLYCGVCSILAMVVPGSRAGPHGVIGIPLVSIPGKSIRFSWFAVHPGTVAMLVGITVLLLIATLLNGMPRATARGRITLGIAGIASFGAVLL